MREKQKTEALKRMKLLNLHKNVYLEFFNKNKLNLSEWPGTLFYLNEKEKEIVSDFENEFNSLVYHVIKTKTNDEVIYSLLYVSQHEEEWKTDIENIENKSIFAYVFNEAEPFFSEFGLIGIQPNIGGLIRTW